jgi:hypothetical protein
MAWFGVGYQLYYNITEAIAQNLLMTEHLINFFSYFTIETNLIIAVVLTIFCARPQAGRFLTGPSLSAALVVYVFFGLGAGVTALDRALGSDSRGRSGLGRAAEL